MNAQDRRFAENVRATEHAPGHAILLEHATAIIEYSRYRFWLFVIAAAVLIVTPPLGPWVNFLIPIAISIALIVLLHRRDKRITAEFDAARDEYLYPAIFRKGGK